ncbi:nucleolar RNA associated protein, putative [Babesia ovis]|uniref:Nucleolar RNA associated protein, putative n=1 Tax=Babesia ovis TaxID=5869 RepID=A0A9W5TA36_BABOV|nr:nucleolar RNA associated protein, putative [Babesia ovis]
MEDNKRTRKRRNTIKSRHQSDTDTTLVNEVLDSGVIYGRSLPLSRINRLIDSNIKRWSFNPEAGDMVSRLINNLSTCLQGIKTTRITKDILDDPRYASYFQKGFNAHWTDYDYGPPKNVEIVGTASLDIVDVYQPQIDVSIELPQSIFNVKDYLNYRYLNKRNAWLCRLDEDLKGLFKNKRNPLLDGIEGSVESRLCFSKPKVWILLVLQSNTIKYFINIYAHVDESTFKHAAMSPVRNNVRTPTTLVWDDGGDTKGEEPMMCPTPSYNSSIMEDLLKMKLKNRLLIAVQRYHKMVGALTLLRIWAINQGLISEEYKQINGCSLGETLVDAACVSDVQDVHHIDTMWNGLSQEILCLILLHIVESNNYPTDIESFPLFLATLKFIAAMDIEKYAYILGAQKAPLDQNGFPMTLKDLAISGNSKNGEERIEVTQNVKKHVSIPQFYFDKDMTYNILYNMTLTFNEVIYKARQTIEVTRDMASPFLYGQLFDISHDPICHHDIKLLIPISPKLDNFDIWELHQAEYMASRVKQTLEYGLGDRLHHVYFRFNSEGVLMVLIGLNDSIQRMTDLGPQTNSAEAIEFRRFWGKLVETRSFNDGTISECLLWKNILPLENDTTDISTSLQRCAQANLNVRILCILLQLKFKEFEMKNMDLQGVDGSYTNSLRVNNGKPVMYMQMPIVEVDHRLVSDYRRKLMNVYNELNGILRSLQNVPLKVSNVFTCSPEFGYVDMGTYTGHHKLLLELETSTKWPNDKNAIVSIKVALGISILKELKRNHSIISKLTEEGDMEIKYKGIKFDVHILCQRQVQPIIDTVRHFNPDVQKLPTDDLLDTVRYYFRSVHIERCKVVALKAPCFSAAVKLSKAFAADCLLPDMEYICEMLNCFIFGSKDFMTSTTASVYTGFTKFLYLVAHYDWLNNPLVIHEDVANYDVLTYRKQPWSKYFWVSTPEDPYCLVPKMPSTLLSKRFVVQCSNFISQLERRHMAPINLRKYFQNNTRGYNMVIQLDNIYRKLKYSTNNETIQLSVDEARYMIYTFLSALQQRFHSFMEIGYNQLLLGGAYSTSGDLKIYAKINPISCIPTGHPKGIWPQWMLELENIKVYIPNIPSIICHIRDMGYGLVRSIVFT